jgi:hypothetical protein
MIACMHICMLLGELVAWCVSWQSDCKMVVAMGLWRWRTSGGGLMAVGSDGGGDGLMAVADWQRWWLALEH